jgi:hypothetical protein
MGIRLWNKIESELELWDEADDVLSGKLKALDKKKKATVTNAVMS